MKLYNTKFSAKCAAKNEIEFTNKDFIPDFILKLNFTKAVCIGERNNPPFFLIISVRSQYTVELQWLEHL